MKKFEMDEHAIMFTHINEWLLESYFYRIKTKRSFYSYIKEENMKKKEALLYMNIITL